MSIFGINRAIDAVQREIYNSEYLFTKNELRASSSNVFIVFENVIKELFHIYSYLLYGEEYENKLSYLLKRKKLMLGDAIEYSYKINDELNRLKDSNTLTYDIGRNYFIFNGKDNNYKKSKEISSIRGKIIHDDIHEFKDLNEYKNTINYGINLCIEVLKSFRDNGIFPRLFELESVIEGNEMLITNFRDEIGSTLPVNFMNRSKISSISGQVYIFSGKNNNKIIPAKIKIDYLYNASIKSKYLKLDVKDESERIGDLYLKISDREEIVPLLRGRRLFGRHIENDVIFKYRSISRRQCMFEMTDEGTFVVDLGSTFGTRINGIKIEPFKKYSLFEKDEITIGEKKESVVITVMK